MSEAQEAKTVLEVRGITKKYPGVVANDGVDLDLREGEIHCLLGENGAGKSTLMNIIYGLSAPDSGEIRLRGEPIFLRSPKDAIARGIGMVHQHFMLVPVFTVTENIMLGAEELRGVVLDRRKVSARVRELSQKYGLAVDPEARVEELPVGTQQRVEIVKALYRDCKILILDEPTAALDTESERTVIEALNRLMKGRTVITIAHRLSTIRNCDKILVLKEGVVAEEGTHEELLALGGVYADLYRAQFETSSAKAEL